ncbi:MAG: MBL fold metallo-hydrolase [Tannerellaceae bacterium]|jgi:glyoxylase-like metal-dependent hydrolase (beta-lactamase superfamily II)|nr:MBL fold metallo-hydrolase [Tannerellaceae bacterium]
MITPIRQKAIGDILKNIKHPSELKVGGCVCVCNGVACDCDCTVDGHCTCDCGTGDDGRCRCDCKKPEKPEERRVLKAVLSVLLLLTVLQGSGMRAQNGGEQLVMTFEIGQAQVSVLSEEQRSGRVDALTGATPQMIQTHVPDGSYPSAVNAFLVRMPDRNILVDAGYGRKLFDHLDALDVEPGDIHAVLLTHLHGDHIGGMLRDGKAAFPHADIYLSQPEYDYWTGNRSAQALPAQKVIEVYRDRLHLFVPADLPDSGASAGPALLLPGVQGIAAYGHTPGHTAYLFESGGARLLVWGDLTHAMRIQMPCPGVTYARDTDTEQSVATRRRILSYVAEKNIPIAGMHIAFPGMGNVVSAGNDSYAFEPYCLCLGI